MGALNKYHMYVVVVVIVVVIVVVLVIMVVVMVFILDRHARNVAKACNFHTRALRHVRSLLTADVAQTVACSIVASRLDYCNALLSGAPAASFDRLQRAQNNLARVVYSSARAGVAPTPGRCFTRYTGFR